LAAAAKTLFRLAARNASHFGVTSCHAFHFRSENGMKRFASMAKRSKFSCLPEFPFADSFAFQFI
jgi:hypothetical protein